jgi:hypothetical protein
MDKKDIFKIGIPTLLISVVLVFLIGETIALAEEARALPGDVIHATCKIKAGKEQDAMKWSKERSDHNRKMGRITARKYLEKTEKGTIMHWVSEVPDKSKRAKGGKERKGDPVLKTIGEKYPDIWDGPRKVVVWQAIH